MSSGEYHKKNVSYINANVDQANVDSSFDEAPTENSFLKEVKAEAQYEAIGP